VIENWRVYSRGLRGFPTPIEEAMLEFARENHWTEATEA
jgi:hypothetical protein